MHSLQKSFRNLIRILYMKNVSVDLDHSLFRYGKNCQSRCQCVMNQTASCDNRYGFCTCKDGFVGSRCEHPCPIGFYGASCNKTCPLCQHSAPCNPVSCKSIKQASLPKFEVNSRRWIIMSKTTCKELPVKYVCVSCSRMLFPLMCINVACSYNKYRFIILIKTYRLKMIFLVLHWKLYVLTDAILQ